MNAREDIWPIMLRLLPARSTMTHWAMEVDQYLNAKHQLDRQKSQRAEQAKQTTGGQER